MECRNVEPVSQSPAHHDVDSNEPKKAFIHSFIHSFMHSTFLPETAEHKYGIGCLKV
jgi:hypothetical protein